MLQASTIDFLLALRANNNREWFHDHQKAYEAVKKDYKQLVAAVLEEMKQRDPNLAVLTEKDCTFRIARDIRFSKDKTPYKTHLGIGLSTFGKKSGMGEYYVHLEPAGQSFAGGGIYMPSPEQLKKMRAEIAAFGEDLEKIIADKNFQKTYGDLDRDILLKRAPKGVDEDHRFIEFLKLKSYTAVFKLSEDLFTSKDLVPYVVERLAHLTPFINFLNRGVSAEEESW